MIEKKDKSMICRMAGNIVGCIYADSGDTGEEDAKRAVDIAIAIIEEVNDRLGYTKGTDAK